MLINKPFKEREVRKKRVKTKKAERTDVFIETITNVISKEVFN